MNQTRICIIEDDLAIQRVLSFALKVTGYVVETASAGDTGLDLALRIRPDLVLLDIMLPGLDGLEVCRRLREQPETRKIPVVMLTAKGETDDIVRGLDAGANDYVTKPFEKEVLLARIRAALRIRDADADGRACTLHGLVIDDVSHEVSLEGRVLELTLSEYRILDLLVRNAGRVFSRGTIIDRISDGEKIVTDRTIDVQMVGLRRKLGRWAEHVKTIRGVGYRAE